MDVATLKTVIETAYSYGLPGQKWFPTADMTTFCNIAVQWMLRQFGYERLSGHANEMVAEMKTNGDWEIVDAVHAQNLANQGRIIIAGWANPTGGHGHVCIVMPGELQYSGKWKANEPDVMNIGTVNFINKSLSFAFSPEHVPTLFCLKESSLS